MDNNEEFGVVLEMQGKASWTSKLTKYIYRLYDSPGGCLWDHVTHCGIDQRLYGFLRESKQPLLVQFTVHTMTIILELAE